MQFIGDSSQMMVQKRPFRPTGLAWRSTAGRSDYSVYAGSVNLFQRINLRI